VKEKASIYVPAIGAVTIAVLLRNLLRIVQNRDEHERERDEPNRVQVDDNPGRAQDQEVKDKPNGVQDNEGKAYTANGIQDHKVDDTPKTPEAGPIL
jgi:hypothetical protein